VLNSAQLCAKLSDALSKGPPNSKPKKPAAALKTVQLDSQFRERLVGSVKAVHRPVLVVMIGNEAGFRKPVEQTALVGRDPAADLVLTDVGVSWHHARIEDRGDSWAIVDLASTNGTFVNTERVQERVLAPRDTIMFARTVVRFEVQDALEQVYDDTVERLLNIDDLSGLYVRRKFDAELDRLIAAARHGNQPLGLLVMDLDGIKGINDTHGHLFGAYVIGEAGHVIGQVLPPQGIGSRFGGDEYCAALPGLALEPTVSAAERIHQAIGVHRFEKDGVVLRPGISIGAAVFPDNGQERRELFQRADEALYRAKNGGKNRVCT
jgi:two-component system, cell cycle response regulator